MNWFTLLKQPELRTGSKVTTNLGSSSDNQPDEPCKKKLLDYREKLKNKKGVLTNFTMKSETFQFNQGERESKYGGLIRELVVYYLDNTSNEASFDKLPEDVACKALKMFSEMSGNKTRLNKQIGDNYWCKVVRQIIPNQLDEMYFAVRLVIMVDNNDGPEVLDLLHELYVPFDEMRTNITHHSMLLDKMDWR